MKSETTNLKTFGLHIYDVCPLPSDNDSVIRPFFIYHVHVINEHSVKGVYKGGGFRDVMFFLLL